MGSLGGAADKDSAMVHFLDAIAWEYVCTQSAEAFEALIDGIGERARSAFDTALEIAGERKRYWIAEARERSVNGIVGERIPVRIDPSQRSIFHDLHLQFKALPGAGQDLQAMFLDGGQNEICPGPKDPQ